MNKDKEISPQEAMLAFSRVVRTAERDALVKQLFPEGIGPYEQEKVVARIRRHFPEVSRSKIYKMNPGQLVVYLKEVAANEQLQIVAGDGGEPVAARRPGARPRVVAALQRLVNELEDYLDNEYSDGSVDPFDPIDADHAIHKAVCGVQSDCYGGQPLPPAPRGIWIELHRWSGKEEDSLSETGIAERRDNIRQHAADLLEWAKAQVEGRTASDIGNTTTGPEAGAGGTKYILSVSCWEDLGIGIDEDGSLLAYSPCPSTGDFVRLRDGARLDLTGDRWPKVLACLARSELGNSASKAELTMELGYMKAGTVSEDQAEFSAELKADASRALRTLTGAMADLGRQLRKLVNCPQSQVFTSDSDFYRSGFVVRHLCRNEARRICFGFRPERTRAGDQRRPAPSPVTKR